MLQRKLTTKLLYALQTNPVVFLNGPRQAGKSTLTQLLLTRGFKAEYVTFDNITQMSAAASAPESYLKNRNAALIIDEVQMVPEIFRALKLVVDELRLNNKAQSYGKYLLTGSANIMALPKLSDALVGRMSVNTLYPFSACEVQNTNGDFISRLFNIRFEKSNTYELNEVISKSTFPEISVSDAQQRIEWFDSYITTILQRDVRLLSEIEKIAMLPVLLRILAARAGKLISDAEIARDIGMNAVTTKTYRGILQAMFLTFDVMPWYRNIGKRLVKSSKGYIIDTMLLCYLLDLNLSDIQIRKPELYGHIVENFVATELVKLITFSDVNAKLYHFRTSDDKEVDFIIERQDGTVCGIEVKTSDNVDASAFKGLKVLQELAGNDFISGIVLYNGREIIPFGERLYAIPISCLWV